MVKPYIKISGFFYTVRDCIADCRSIRAGAYRLILPFSIFTDASAVFSPLSFSAETVIVSVSISSSIYMRRSFEKSMPSGTSIYVVSGQAPVRMPIRSLWIAIQMPDCVVASAEALSRRSPK